MEHYRYYQNKECEYFPCHKGADCDNFNCLFCYCPLYALGENCGGNFTYTDKGYKDCSSCLVPHKAENYKKIVDRFAEVAEIAKKK